MPRGHLPYRGEFRPKLYGKPSPSKPGDKVIEQVFWAILTLAGLVIFYYAVLGVAKNDFSVAFVFVLYLMIYAIFYFSYQDAQKIPLLTSEEPDSEDDNSELAEDYIQQINWHANHRHQRTASQVEWQYKPVLAKRETSNFGCLQVLLIMFGVAGLAIVVAFFNINFDRNSWQFFGVLVGSGVLSLIIYFVWQEKND